MRTLTLVVIALGLTPQDPAAEHPLNTWVKHTPLATTPTSPRLGYEGDCAWDPVHKVILRYGGHNQGGGGEQNSEIWTCDPFTGKWTFKEPNFSPPGVCCAQQNVFDPVASRYLRFPAFSGSHGWQWQREIMMNQSSVWSYDLEVNLWRNMKPFPTVPLSPLRCASWDSEQEVVIIFGGEGSSQGTLVYDPYTNIWTRMKPAKQPEFRSGGNMTYDAARKIHILYGTQFGNDPVTWAYDLRKNEWRDLKPETSPPSKENDAVLKYDAVAKVVIAIVKLSEGKDEQAKHELQTWAYDAGANTWKKMNPEREPDPTGNRARVLMAAPELNLIFLENCPSRPREQQIWSYRTAAGKPAPAPVRLQAKTEAGTTILSWTSVDRPLPLYRGSGEQPWEVEFEEIAQIKAGASEYRDANLRAGTVYHYRLGSDGLRVRTQPRAPEEGVVSVSESAIEIAWKPSPEADVAGYVVEEARVEPATDDQLSKLKARTPPLDEPSVGALKSVGAFQRVTEAPVKGTSWIVHRTLHPMASRLARPIYQREFGKEDWDANGKAYRFEVFAYRIRAVNTLGVESGPSPAMLTIPSPPQFLFAKEESTTAHLKWAANPEKGIKGYRVYRMDGRYDKEPVERLTPDPVTALTFSDPDAGKKSRRYYVIAVDAMGQEGYPSSPVWFAREWKPFYLPFSGDWHQ